MAELSTTSDQAGGARARLSYHTGHGDFCFGRLTAYSISLVPRIHSVRQYLTAQSLFKDSSNALFNELDGFQRCASGSNLKYIRI